jgi:hypothetical protein
MGVSFMFSTFEEHLFPFFNKFKIFVLTCVILFLFFVCTLEMKMMKNFVAYRNKVRDEHPTLARSSNQHRPV